MKILIVGQGIAGVMLAHVLQQQGARVTVADGQLPGRSSAVAAGIINPVTGKRFVKSWKLDTFFPAAQQRYQALEALLGITVWETRPILRLLGTAEEANDWSTRCAMPDYSPFLGEAPDAGDWAPLLHPGFRFGYIQQAARVNFPLLLQTYRNHLNDLGQFLPQIIQVSELDHWLKLYDRIVFCEGYRAVDNTLFPGLRWQLAKGEALHIRFREHRTDHIVDMVKKTSLIAPLGNGLFWAGGSYQWHYQDLAPSEGERQYILQRLHEMLLAPFEIVDHVAGVRPSVKDRRPFLGESPVKKRVFLFNGLGTKGALLAPYWATRMAEHLLEGAPLDPEVTLHRQ